MKAENVNNGENHPSAAENGYSNLNQYNEKLKIY
jgi:hypothetical protein